MKSFIEHRSPAGRKKIKALTKETRTQAALYRTDASCRSIGFEMAQLLEDLADVAEEYLKGLK